MLTAHNHAIESATRRPSLVLCELADTGIGGMESYSPFCLKVHRALKAAGLAYDRAHGGQPSFHKAHNPAAQVPVLLVDGEPVFDSTRILERIDTLGGTRLNGSPDPRVRAEARLWEELADTALNGFLVAARWGDPRNWGPVREAYFGAAPWFVKALIAPRIRAHVLRGLVARDVYRRGDEACWERFGQLLDELDARAPVTGFWVSETLSVADIAIFAQLHALRTDLTPWQRSELARRSRLSRFLDRVDSATSGAAAARPSRAPLSASLGLAAE